MNDFQSAYVAVLVALLIVARQDRVYWWTVFSVVVSLGLAGLMDISVMQPAWARSLMMLADTVTAAILLRHPGASRVQGGLFALGAALYIPHLVFSYPPAATFAIVYIVNVAQLGVLAVGTFGSGGSRLRFRRRPRNVRSGLAASPGNCGLVRGGAALASEGGR